jgi:hypothetical protein
MRNALRTIEFLGMRPDQRWQSQFFSVSPPLLRFSVVNSVTSATSVLDGKLKLDLPTASSSVISLHLHGNRHVQLAVADDGWRVDAISPPKTCGAIRTKSELA